MEGRKLAFIVLEYPIITVDVEKYCTLKITKLDSLLTGNPRTCWFSGPMVINSSESIEKVEDHLPSSLRCEGTSWNSQYNLKKQERSGYSRNFQIMVGVPVYLYGNSNAIGKQRKLNLFYNILADVLY